MISSSTQELYPMDRGVSLHAVQVELSTEKERYDQNIKLMRVRGVSIEPDNPIYDKQQEMFLIFQKSIAGLNPVNKAIETFNRKEVLRVLNNEIDLFLDPV